MSQSGSWKSTALIGVLLISSAASTWGQVPEVNTRGDWDTYSYTVQGSIPGLTQGTAQPVEIVIAVHGFDPRLPFRDLLPIRELSPREAAQRQFQGLQSSLASLGEYQPVVGYTWDSDARATPDGWEMGKRNAFANGRKLAQFIDDYKSRSPGTKIHLIAHSLGCRVALEAILALARDPHYRWNRSLAGARIDDVHLMGAAVGDEEPQTNQRYGRAIEAEVGWLYNYYSREDDWLQFAYSLWERNPALGLSGIESPSRRPRNYRELSVEHLLGSSGVFPPGETTPGDDHNGYWFSTSLTPGVGVMEVAVSNFTRPVVPPPDLDVRLSVSPLEASRVPPGTDLTFTVDIPNYPGGSVELAFWLEQQTDPKLTRLPGQFFATGSHTVLRRNIVTDTPANRGSVAFYVQALIGGRLRGTSKKVAVSVITGTFGLSVAPSSARVDSGDPLTLKVDTSAFLNADVELIFRLEQEKEPKSWEFYRTMTRGERGVVVQRSPRELPVNSGVVTFKVQVSNIGSDPRFAEYATAPNNTREAKVQVTPQDGRYFSVTPERARLENTDLKFYVYYPPADGKPATYIFYGKQESQPKDFEVGRYHSDKGEVVRYWNIRGTPANKGLVRFWVRVESTESWNSPDVPVQVE